MRALILVLLLAGCTPSQRIERVRALDAKIEPEVDAALDFAGERFCRLPVDILNRRMTDGLMAEAIFLACPTVQVMGYRLADVIDARNEAGMEMPDETGP